jgi:hypothetical protein
MKLAIFGCWRGHSTKAEYADQRSFETRMPSSPNCAKCGERTTLYSVMETKPRLYVIDGGIHPASNPKETP